MHVQGLKKRHIELVMSLPFLAMLKSCARIHLPPGGALGVLPAIDGCFSGELIFMLALPFGAAAGDERKNSGDEDAIFWRAACDVPCDWGCCDRRGAGEDIVANVGECLSVEVRLSRVAEERTQDASNASRKSIYYGRLQTHLCFFNLGCAREPE